MEYTISVWTINILACFSGCVCGGGGVGKRADSISGSGGGGVHYCHVIPCHAFWLYGGGGESRGGVHHRCVDYTYLVIWHGWGGG